MVIELKNVSKEYKDNLVLDDINLKFESGNIYGFVGRNGSGKTVLLKLISGFINPTKGSISFDGKVLHKDIKLPPNLRCLIENPSFIPMMSGYDNLKLLADILHKIGEKEIIDTLKSVNLYEAKDKTYHKYSLGMKQKLGIAQVLMEDPDIIVLDEPFNGMDDESIEKIRNILLEKKSEGKLILIASHIKEDMNILADYVYEVKNSKVTKI